MEKAEAVAQMCFAKKVFLKMLQHSQEKTFNSLFFNKKACNFIKKGLQYRCFPVKLAKF